MKSFTVCLAVLVLVVALVQGQGVPTKNCPYGEHSVLYCPRKAEPDCDDPTVHNPRFPGPCDVPDCFCNPPTVRDHRNGLCVNVEDCPKKF